MARGLVGAAVLTTAVAAAWSNWNGEQTCAPASFTTATTEAEVSAVITQAATAGQTVKVIGFGHSFSPIDLTTGVMLALSPPPPPQGLTMLSAGVARVHAGLHIWEINAQLEPLGWALSNMGAIENQTLAGAVATSTHGTGNTGSFSSFVVGFTAVLANGTVVNASASENAALFTVMRTGYGALGVMVWLNIAVVPVWTMEQITVPLPLPTLLRQLPALKAQFPRLQWYYYPYTDTNATLLLRVNTTAAITGCWNPMGPPPTRPVTPPPAGWSAWPAGTASCVDVSYKTMTHNGDDVDLYTEMEMMVPAEDDLAIVNDFLTLQEALKPRHDPAVSLFTGVRYVQGDDIPLSPFYGRDTAVVSMIIMGNATDGGNQTEVTMYDTALQQLAYIEYHGRPHPGKMNWFTASMMATAYPDTYSTFVAARAELDPTGMFANAYINALFGPPAQRVAG